MKRTARFCALITALLLSPVHSFGQAAIGMQYFGSFGGGPIDNVNLGNLNNHLDIPIRNKAGRGMPFAYDLTYDSTLWYPTVVNGVKTWEPSVFSGYWGWQNLLYAASGGLTYSTSTSGGSCGQFGQYTWSQTEYSNFVYTDWSGSHPFGYTAYYISSNGPSGQCPPTGPEPATAAPIPAEDKSGITLYAVATSSSVSAYETLPSGYYKFNAGGGATGMDANGNEITFNSGNYTDTLGQTALTVAGGNPPTATTFSYTAPSGAAATYAVSYKSYTVETAFGCSGVAEYNQSGTYLVDRITLPDTSYYQFQYEQTPGAGIGTVTARLSSVTLPTGGSIAYAYGTTNSGNNNGINCSDGTAPVGTSTNPSLVRTLTPGGAWKYVRTNVSGSHWQTTVTSPPDPTIGNDTVIDFQEDGNTNTNDFFETQRLVYQGSSGGSPLNTVITCYNGTSNPTPTSCPTTTAVVSPITRITSFSGLPDTTAVNETDTQYGYISVPGYETEVDSYDYGSSVPGSLLRKVITAYSAFGTTVQPTSVQIQDGSGATKASTIYTYDETTPTPTSGTPQQFSVNGGRGNLTTLASQVSNSVTLYRKFTYYDTGMLNTASDPGKTSSGGPNITTYNYNNSGSPSPSCGNSFVTSISEPLSLTRQFTWDCNGGVQTSITDENGQVSTTYYAQSSSYGTPDPSYWRPYATTDQLNNPTALSYPNNMVAESALQFNSNKSVTDVRTKADAFGRAILSQAKEGPTSSTYDVTQTDYDTLNRVSKTYVPFISTIVDAPCSGTCPGVITSYDALYRALQVTDAGNGITAYAYTKNDVYQELGPPPSGENTKKKQLEFDGLGRLKSVCEITAATGSGNCAQVTGQTGFWTTYSYDVLGDMTNVTQNAQAPSGSQQYRSYLYDMLGRMTSEQNPETGSSAISYTYDIADSSCGSYSSPGDLVEKKDAMGNVTCLQYDALHRVKQTTYPSGSYASVTPTKCYVYDSATVNGNAMSNAKFRLADAYTTSAASCPGTATVDEGFSYSARGENTDIYESTPHSAGYYHTSVAYNPNGGVNSIGGIPGFATYNFGVDGEGRPFNASQGSTWFVGSSSTTGVSYDPASRPLTVPFGSSGDNDTYTYDSLERVHTYAFSVNGKSMSGTLGWNLNGSLGTLGITDTFNSGGAQNCTFTYDDAARLVTDNCGSSLWNQSYSYDQYGNLTKTGNPGTSWNPGYNSSNNHMIGSSYDADGNLLYDGVNTYAWDEDGKLASARTGPTPAVCGSSGTCNTYDAFGRLAETNLSGSYRQELYSPIGRIAHMNGQSGAVYLPLPGGPVLYAHPSDHYIMHSDWVGSKRLNTSLDNRSMYYDTAYSPYGESYDTFGSLGQDFTGDVQDIFAGLFDTPNRELATNASRWLSPDPAGMAAVDPTNPQSWNRYAYVVNNPLAFVDPLGLGPCKEGAPYYETDCQPPTSSASNCPVGEMGLSVGGGPSFCAPDYLLPYLMNLGNQCTNYVMANCGAASGGGGNAANNDPCANATLSATGVNIHQNIAAANVAVSLGYAAGSSNPFAPPNPFGGLIGALYGYDQLVHTGGPQDVKNQPGPGTPQQRVDAGNISFGVTCPFGAGFCQFAAGVAQTLAGNPNPNGTLLTGFDTPSDNAGIRVGQVMRAAGCHE